MTLIPSEMHFSNKNIELIEKLKSIFYCELRNHIGQDTNVALLDFPDHSNVGDSAIWLGEITAIKDITGRNPNYVCTISDYNKLDLSDAIGEGGVILIHGGGNFGDIWIEHQDFREQVCYDFPNHRIVQLPQSIWFDSDERKIKAANVFKNHSDFHLMVRDNQSLKIAETLYCKSYLVPDAAFCIGPIRVNRPPIAPSVLLARSDKEKSLQSEKMNTFAEPLTRHSDWLEEDVSVILSLIDYKSERVGKCEAWNAAAEYRLARGVEILSFGKVVITDRLHGHIISVLLGLPNIVFDNNYGKISQFISVWTEKESETKIASF